MKKGIVILLICISAFKAQSQRINFRPFVQNEMISVNVVNNATGLNFNNKASFIILGSGDIVDIALSDPQVVVVEIDAPLEYDITINLQLPDQLIFQGVDVNNAIPLQLRMAYSNTGESNFMSARMAATVVPVGFNILTLPMLRRGGFGGPPPPPPTPEHGGFIRPRGKVYIFLYGTLGPIPANIFAGTYLADVDVSISFSDNSF